MTDSPRRFTRAYALLVLAWLLQAGFAFGLVVPREPGWAEWAALGLVAAVGPLLPEEAVPYLIPVPVIALVIAVLTEPALWR